MKQITETTYSIWKVGNFYEVRATSPWNEFDKMPSAYAWEAVVGRYPWLWAAKMKVQLLRDKERKRIERAQRPEQRIEF